MNIETIDDQISQIQKLIQAEITEESTHIEVNLKGFKTIFPSQESRVAPKKTLGGRSAFNDFPSKDPLETSSQASVNVSKRVGCFF